MSSIPINYYPFSIRASHNDGVQTLTLPVSERTRPRRTQVRRGGEGQPGGERSRRSAVPPDPTLGPRRRLGPEARAELELAQAVERARHARRWAYFSTILAFLAAAGAVVAIVSLLAEEERPTPAVSHGVMQQLRERARGAD